MPTVECPNCLKKLNAPLEHKGRTVKCGDCGKSFVLRFLDKDAPAISTKMVGNRSEPRTDQLKSTISFRMPQEPPPAPAPPESRQPASPSSAGSARDVQKARSPQKPKRKKPHRGG